MSTKWTESSIGRLIAQQTFARRYVCLVDRCNFTGDECDLLAVTQNLRLIDVEIKISRADFRADARKDKWWRYGVMSQRKPQTELVWPPKAWKHYFCMPEDLWRPEMVAELPSPACGVLLVRDKHGYPQIYAERPAKTQPNAYRLSPEEAVHVARLANLRMWDAYRDADNLRFQLQAKQ